MKTFITQNLYGQVWFTTYNFDHFDEISDLDPRTFKNCGLSTVFMSSKVLTTQG